MPALVISADKDQLVPLPETFALSRQIAGSKLVLFPGQAHPLAVCPLDDIARTMGTWLRRPKLRCKLSGAPKERNRRSSGLRKQQHIVYPRDDGN